MSNQVVNGMDYQTFKELNEKLNKVVLNTISILEGYENLDKKNIEQYLQQVREDALKIAGNPLTEEKAQEMVGRINTALNEALKQISNNGGVDAEAIKGVITKDLENVKTGIINDLNPIKDAVTKMQQEIQKNLKAFADSKEELTKEIQKNLKKQIVVSERQGVDYDFDAIVGDKQIKIHLFQSAKAYHPASTLSLLDWAEYIEDAHSKHYLSIKGYGGGRSILREYEKDDKFYKFDILAHIKEQVTEVIPLNGNYMLLCGEEKYCYVLGLDAHLLGFYVDFKDPYKPVKLTFPDSIKDAYNTGDTTYVLLNNGDIWASGRNPYTFAFNHNLPSNHAFTFTNFKNVESIKYYADRALDNKNGIAFEKKDNSIMFAGGSGRQLAGGYNGSVITSSNQYYTVYGGYSDLFLLHDAVICKYTNQYWYGVGKSIGHRDGTSAWNYLYNSSFTPMKVLQDSEKTIYLGTDNALYVSTGNAGNNPPIHYGNSVDNKTYYNTSAKLQSDVIDMATSCNRWIIQKKDKSLWSWGKNAEKYAGVTKTPSVTQKAFKIFDEADDFVCGKDFTAVLKGHKLFVCRDLVFSDGFVELYAVPAKKDKKD